MIKLFTWVDHHVDGDSLGLRHETQGWEDGEAGDEAGPTVECTQPQAIPVDTHTHSLFFSVTRDTREHIPFNGQNNSNKGWRKQLVSCL